METVADILEKKQVQNTVQIDYKELSRQIALHMSPAALLTAEDVGAMLNYPARYIRETISNSPGFPKAIRLVLPPEKSNDGSQKKTRKISNRRWRRCDIESWIDAHRNGRRPGTTRRND